MTIRYRPLHSRNLSALLRDRTRLDAAQRRQAAAVAAVFPFRTNQYVVDELVDWSAAPDDPIYRLTFPQPGMLSPADLARMERLVASDAPDGRVRAAANEIRGRLNPHPAGQVEHNSPRLHGRQLAGLQHKYAETLLVFPRPGQTCHAYCTYCFRWPQFVGEPAMKIATDDVAAMVEYLKAHAEVTSVLITGGDPLVMSAAVLRRYLEPLLAIDTISSIRLGTKALSYWPYRVLSDPEADDLLGLLRRVVHSGRQLAVMAHVSHPRELMPAAARQAVARLQDAGPQRYFAVPLARGYEIFRDAYARAPGLARTVRGPVMSTTPGKVCVDGVARWLASGSSRCGCCRPATPTW